MRTFGGLFPAFRRRAFWGLALCARALCAWALCAWAFCGLWACGPSAETGEPPVAQGPRDDDKRNPRPGVLEMLRQDLAADRHSSDGGGTARLLRVEGEPLRASGVGRFHGVYTAGPEGIADGGALYLQVSPFWEWSTPQVEQPDAPGYTEIRTDAEGVVLRSETVDRQLLAVHVEGRALRPGEEIRWTYGAGSSGARVDRFAESDERLWIAVDGNGDGIRKMLAEPPTVTIGPGPPARLLIFPPSTARPGEAVHLHVSVLDRVGNAGLELAGAVRVEVVEGPDGESFATLAEEAAAADRGTWILPWTVGPPGIYRFRAGFTGEDGKSLEAESPPLLVASAAPSIRWADLQVHSNLSDGTGLPRDLYRYGRDVARLDVMSVTDHDHWGLRFLDASPEIWQDLQETTESFHEPGRFVTVRGFEWTNWIHGHRHVLVFDDLPLPILSSVDESYDHPSELWEALRGRQAMTVAHHSAGDPVSTDWTIPPDPVLEPMTEIVSVHGSSEAADSPRLIRGAIAGNFVRDALGRGYRLGFLGSTDGHDGHPGLAHLAGPSGGVAAIFTEDLSRAGVLRALQARRAYATSGPRILLRVLLGGYPMGSEVPVDGDGKIRPREGDERIDLGSDELWVQAVSPGELERVDVIRPGRLESVACGDRECTLAGPITELRAGEFLYVRTVQRDGHFAVSSPFFLVGVD